MEEQVNGEKLKHRPWISIADKLPDHNGCFEVACHNEYGLANWSNNKGFHDMFITSGPGEHADVYENHCCLNYEAMWWREICNWPYYGTRGCDSELMKPFLTENQKNRI